MPTPAWVWGGSALIASALLPILVSTAFADGTLWTAAGWIGMATFAAAMLLFAWGWRRRGSVVGAALTGAVALTVLGLTRPVLAIVSGAVPYSDDTSGFLAALWYVDLVLWLGAALIAVVAIGRAGVVHHPWRWAPLWGLAAVVGVNALLQGVGVAIGSQPNALLVLTALSGFAHLVTTLVPLLLGLLAVVLGLRPDTAARPPSSRVQVYPPEPAES